MESRKAGFAFDLDHYAYNLGEKNPSVNKDDSQQTPQTDIFTFKKWY